MPLDLRDALICLAVMKEMGSPRWEDIKVGIIRRDIPPTAVDLPRGRVVLFWEEKGIPPTITIEYPMTEMEVIRQKSRGTPVFTTGTTMGVPANYVQKIPVKCIKENF
ncbi:MAG: hypothetical protein AAB706_02955 [Patescibacteria group bacterium]